MSPKVGTSALAANRGGFGVALLRHGVNALVHLGHDRVVAPGRIRAVELARRAEADLPAHAADRISHHPIGPVPVQHLQKQIAHHPVTARLLKQGALVQIRQLRHFF
jgi:hypothetical protein